jgi:hypothetical protein
MIDEKILIEKIKEHAEKVGGSVSDGGVKAGYLLAHEHIVDIIHLMQTTSKPVAPVIPPLKAVVLCKDCKVPHNKFIGCKYMNGLVPPPDHFCSFGQRKD